MVRLGRPPELRRTVRDGGRSSHRRTRTLPALGTDLIDGDRMSCSTASEKKINRVSTFSLSGLASSLSGGSPRLALLGVIALAFAAAACTAPALTLAAGCPNEQLRSESGPNPETGSPFSLQLPECRAYEMVSPPLKNGAPFTSLAPEGTATAVHAQSAVGRVGVEGNTVLISSTAVWPGGEQPANNDLLGTQAAEAVRYRVTRGEFGWGFEPQVPPASDLRVYLPFVVPDEADLGLNGMWTGAGLAPGESHSNIPTERGTNGQGNLYLLEPNGALAEVGPSVPLSDRGVPAEGKGGVFPFGASADLSRVLFGVGSFRWPFDQTKLAPPGTSDKINSLYEYFGTGHTGEGDDVPTLVGVDNTGTLISQCGTEGGGRYEGINSTSFAAGAGPISSAGSTVFFTALAAESACATSSSTGAGTGPPVDLLFARVGEPGLGAATGNAVTVNVAGSSDCASAPFDSCNVTAPVAYQGGSADGSKVFFTTEQPLVAGDEDTTNDLYECSLPGDSGTPLARSTPVNPCPDLTGISLSGSTAGADVRSVVAISKDGSHIYFTATGDLTGPNAEGDSPVPGNENLYVWQQPSPGHPLAHTAFIATVPSAPEEVQATPDGDSLVFASAADLTPDDTSTVNQVFLYQALHEALIRVSKGQGGFNDDGNTTTDRASIATGVERRTISEDGSTVVFQSSDALTPQVHGGTNNVYLWRGGDVYLISDGTPGGEHFGNGATQLPEAGLVGIDASGQNVFFTTASKLVGQDTDELSDLYDARVNGGFPPPDRSHCEGEACRLPASPARPDPSPATTASGPGNQPAPAPQCRKDLVRKHGKCVAKAKHHRKHGKHHKKKPHGHKKSNMPAAGNNQGGTK
jgi:hypothetical protein